MDRGRRNGRNRRRERLRRDGSGPHNQQRKADSQGGDSPGGRTTTRALVTVGVYVAQDLRDADGLVRPFLRRAALSLALSSRYPVQRLGSAYLQLDPPARSETTSTGPLRSSSSPLMLTEEAHRDEPSRSAHTAARVEPGDQPSLES
jgi:hypothetical protein